MSLHEVVSAARSFCNALRAKQDRSSVKRQLTASLGTDCELKTREKDYPDLAFPSLVAGLTRRDQKDAAAALRTIYGEVLKLNHGLIAHRDDPAGIIEAAIKDIEEIVGPQKPELIVDVERLTAVFNQPGLNPIEFRLGNETAARWLKGLANHEGRAVTMAELADDDIELAEARATRLREALPLKIRKWIKCQRGKGCCLTLPRR